MQSQRILPNSEASVSYIELLKILFRFQHFSCARKNLDLGSYTFLFGLGCQVAPQLVTCIGLHGLEAWGAGAAWKPKHGKVCVISHIVLVIFIRLQMICRNVQSKVVSYLTDLENKKEKVAVLPLKVICRQCKLSWFSHFSLCR